MFGSEATRFRKADTRHGNERFHGYSLTLVRGHIWAHFLQKPIGSQLLNLNATSVLSHPNGSLPPEPEGQPDDPMKDTPDDLGGEFVAVNRIWLRTAARHKTKITYASY